MSDLVDPKHPSIEELLDSTVRTKASWFGTTVSGFVRVIEIDDVDVTHMGEFLRWNLWHIDEDGVVTTPGSGPFVPKPGCIVVYHPANGSCVDLIICESADREALSVALDAFLQLAHTAAPQLNAILQDAYGATAGIMSAVVQARADEALKRERDAVASAS